MEEVQWCHPSFKDTLSHHYNAVTGMTMQTQKYMEEYIHTPFHGSHATVPVWIVAAPVHPAFVMGLSVCLSVFCQ